MRRLTSGKLVIGILVAVALQPSGGKSRRLVSLGFGCCHGIDLTRGIYYNKVGQTLEECIDLCEKQDLKCMALEHNPWSLGVCSLFDSMATGVGCPLSEKTCWSVRPAEERELPSNEGVLESGRTLPELKRWHAQEVWRSMGCDAGTHVYSRMRGQTIQSLLEGDLDHDSYWKVLLNQIKTEPLDTTGFFSENNNEYLSIFLYRGGRFMNLLRGDVDANLTELRNGSLIDASYCLFGLLFILYIVVMRYHLFGDSDQALEVSWLLRIIHWLSIGGPESMLDLLQSSNWPPITSWDLVAATLPTLSNNSAEPKSSMPAFTYVDREAQVPLPAPFLPTLFADLPRPKRNKDWAARPQRWLPCGLAPGRVATFGIVRQMMMHQLSALQAAWGALCGAHQGPPLLEVIFSYTASGPLAEYDNGGLQDQAVDWDAEVQHWHGMKVHFDGGKSDDKIRALLSLDAVEKDLTVRIGGDSRVANADVVLCGEPVYVCTALARVLEAMRDTRPLLAHLGMALLHHPQKFLTVVDTREKVARFMAHFFAMLVRPNTFVSAANRITIEQIYWQTGVRLPLAHFAGLHLVPNPTREVHHKALLFRSKFPTLSDVFLKALKLYKRHEDSSVELYDMNERSSLSWAEISQFKVCVLLPHNVHLIRTADLYALEVILFVPSAPFIFQFIYPGSNLYAGHGATPAIRLGLDRVSQQALHRAYRVAAFGYRTGISPTSPFPGEQLPRKQHMLCPYRFPSVGSCTREVGNDGTVYMDVCPYGVYDLTAEAQTPLSCKEVFEAEPTLRGVAETLCSSLASVEAGAAQPDIIPEGPALDPFDHLYGDYNPWCNIDAYRYWYGYTDYALMSGLQHFAGVPELLARLESLLVDPGSEERRSAILEEMRTHQQLRVRETVQTWTQALMATTCAGSSAHCASMNNQ